MGEPRGLEGLNLYEKFSVAFLKELAKDPQ